MNTEEFTFKVAGTPYDGRQELLRSLFNNYGCFVDADLLPENNNSHDRFAVGIWSHGVKIGYVPREYSQDVSECMRILLNSKMQIYEEKDLLCAKVFATYGE